MFSQKNIIALIIVGLVIAFFMILPEPNEAEVVPETLAEAETESTGSDQLESLFTTLNQNFIIRNVNLYNGFEFSNNVDVEVFNSQVGRIGKKIQNTKNVVEFDATGKTLIPGLVDAHTHTWGSALTEALNFGVTTELDMFTMPAFSQGHRNLRNQLTNNEQADLFSATILATAPGGHGTEYGFDIPVLENVEQVTQFVSDRVKDGADYIKAVYNSKLSKRQHFPSISMDILRALANESKKHDLMLVVHVDNLISAKEVIAAGAEGIVHSFMDTIVDAEFVELMVENNAFVIPTLLVQASVVGLKPGEKTLEAESFQGFLSNQQQQQLKSNFMDFGIPKAAFERAKKSVKLLSEQGVKILAGTDAPNPGTAHGASMHDELAFLVSSGLTPEQALFAATGATNRSFKIGMRGTIQTGAPASMILLTSNPIIDINATKQIEAIWKNGRLFKRIQAGEIKKENQIASATLISDFESFSSEQKIIATKIGSGISTTSDRLAGGKSKVSFEVFPKDKELATSQGLLVVGEIRQGFIFPWSGLSFLPGQDYTKGLDISEIRAIRFVAEDLENTKALSVMLFQEGSYQPVTVTLDLQSQRQSYSVNLNEFSSVDLTAINNISIVATGKSRSFKFIIDDLELIK